MMIIPFVEDAKLSKICHTAKSDAADQPVRSGIQNHKKCDLSRLSNYGGYSKTRRFQSSKDLKGEPGDPYSPSEGGHGVMEILNFACFKIETRSVRFSVLCATGRPENRRGSAVRASRGRNGAAVAFQQERRCMTAEDPL